MNRRSTGRIFSTMLILFCSLALIGCPIGIIVTEINRCINLNQKIDQAEALLDQLDETMALADGYQVYEVSHRTYDFTSPNGPLKTLIYYPENKTSPSPVVLFSHGLSGSAESQLYLLKGLARRGNIAIAPDHIDFINYNRIGMLGDELKSQKKSKDIVGALTFMIARLIETQLNQILGLLGPLEELNAEQFQALAENGELLQLFRDNFNYRLEDMRVLLDQLPELNDSDPILNGRMNLNKIVMSGASLGGSTTLALALAENPFKALICLSPASHPFPKNDLQKIKTPLLYMAGDQDVFHDEVLRAYNDSLAPKMYQSIKNGGHAIFSDLLFLYGLGIPFISNGQTGFTSNLPIDQQKALLDLALDVSYPVQLKDYQGKALTIVKTVCAFVAAYADDDVASLELLSRTGNNSLVYESFIEF